MANRPHHVFVTRIQDHTILNVCLHDQKVEPGNLSNAIGNDLHFGQDMAVWSRRAVDTPSCFGHPVNGLSTSFLFTVFQVNDGSASRERSFAVATRDSGFGIRKLHILNQTRALALKMLRNWHTGCNPPTRRISS